MKRSYALLAACLIAGGLLLGCEKTTLEPADREEIRATLEEYLPKLARAYAERDPELISDMAVEKEVASVHRLIDELAERGEYMVPSLRSLTIEEDRLWRRTTFVTTLEVWDLERRALGSDVVLQDYSGQRNRVNYHLRREDDRWQVMLRQVVDRDIE